MNETWQPLGFFTKALTTAQKKYSAYDRELLTVYDAVKKFRHILKGVSFVIYTDLKPLTFAFKQKSDKCSPRQFRYLDFIGQFSIDIRHIAGKENFVVDALSRINEITIIDYKEIARQ